MARLAAGTLAATLLSGCYAFRPVSRDEARFLASPARLRIARPDGPTVQLDSAQVSADSVTGVTRSLRVAIPLRDVTEIQMRALAPARTEGLIVLAGAGLGAATYFLVIKPANNGGGCPPLTAFFPCTSNAQCCAGGVP